MDGKKVLDAKDHPLHVMSYSLPVDKIVSKDELLKHLHSRSDRPNAIPFEFKYYERDWGFCIQHKKLKKINKEKYKILIDSKFEKGNLKVGDKVHIQGTQDDFEQMVESMQLDHKDVKSGKKGNLVAVKVDSPVHKNDKVSVVGK